MEVYGKRFIHANIYDFKSNISRYIRMIRAGEYEGVIVRRHSQPVGLFVPLRKSPERMPGDTSHLDEVLEKLK